MIGLRGTTTSSQASSQLDFFTRFPLSAIQDNQGKKWVTDRHWPISKAAVA